MSAHKMAFSNDGFEIVVTMKGDPDLSAVWGRVVERVMDTLREPVPMLTLTRDEETLVGFERDRNRWGE